jgi:hypothetical protein
MSYNGSGTFNINTSGQPVVAGTVITASAFNALTTDLATGLTTAITKDGQTATTARIPFAQGISSTLVTDATNTTSGSIVTDGGVGIAKALYVGTTANIGGTTDSSSISTGAIITAGGVGIAKNLYVGGTLNVTGNTSFTNPVINNIKMGYTTTATAAGTTTLTVASNYRQFFTGSTTQTIVLPVTSTLVTGIAYEIENNSTGTLTVNSSGGNLVGTVPAGVCAHAVCIGTTLTTAADWDWDYISTTTITGTGANVLATSPTLVTPALGTPSALVLTNATGLPAAQLTGTQTIPKSTLPTGSVLQVVYGSTTTQLEASFSSATDLGLSASITPTSSSSKILVLVSANGLASRSSSTYWDGYLVRGSTNLGAFVNYLGTNIGDAGYWGASLSYLDSPATTSSTTYKLQGIRRAGSGNCLFNITTGNSGTGNISGITLMEISA